MNPRFLAYLSYCKKNNIDRNTYPYSVFINTFIAKIRAKYFKRKTQILFLNHLTNFGHEFFTRYLCLISK